MKRQVLIDEIEQSDIVVCTISWVLVSLYIQIGITYLALVTTTVLYHSIFLLALTAFFVSLMCFVQYTLSPKTIYIINDKE